MEFSAPWNSSIAMRLDPADGGALYVTRDGAKKQEPETLLFVRGGRGDHDPVAVDDLPEDGGRNVPVFRADFERPGGLGEAGGGRVVRGEAGGQAGEAGSMSRWRLGRESGSRRQSSATP